MRYVGTGHALSGKDNGILAFISLIIYILTHPPKINVHTKGAHGLQMHSFCGGETSTLRLATGYPPAAYCCVHPNEL